MCLKQTYLLLQFCLEPALHVTRPETALSANQTRAVCYLLGFAKPLWLWLDLLPCTSPPLSGASSGVGGSRQGNSEPLADSG